MTESTREGASKGRIGVLLRTYPKLSETFIAQEIELLEQRGFDFAIVAYRDPGEPQIQAVIERIRAPVHYLPRGRGSARAYARSHARALAGGPLRYALALARALVRQGVAPGEAPLRAFLDAGWLVGELGLGRGGLAHLHAHYLQKTARLARAAARWAGVGYTISAHAVDIYTEPPKRVARLVADSRALMTCTGVNAAYLRELAGPQADRVHLVYHGIDLRRFAPDPARGAPERVRFLAVGRLVPKKGYDDLLEALARVRAAGVDAGFEIFGAGPLAGELEEQRTRLGLDAAVTLHGAVTQDQIAQALGRGGIFLCGSVELADGNRDGIPNTVAEAMALGLPVVATRVSAIPELVEDGKSGLLVPQRDPEALAEAMLRLARDPEEARRLGSGARQRVEEIFDADRCIEACARLLAAHAPPQRPEE
ncbi:MAG: glycosyltransferase family 4 protein [Proteobacteria bacterium]|nr:glycosyltransferase family 4 protein [Pseudomonadota bacterium]